ncbi:hypothetical protein FB566_4944 [Stackebrandtia endophytica]|uniref:Uncharacterized protein n=1 Tax=Stackebrandtia endophytica TaxID=1496996 RepID=A0A543B3H4_9ACTN|nr:hypothetical protein [Stackebrandtia endophytica]TQL79343.1 hypothetical protein FB566_4944 [Stackebrandtia endophytica]
MIDHENTVDTRPSRRARRPWLLHTVTGLHGTPRSIAALPRGPVYAVTDAGVLVALTVTGQIVQRTPMGAEPGEVRVTADGCAWVIVGDRRRLQEVRPNGTLGRTLAPAHDLGEHIGMFLPLGNDFLIAWSSLSYDRVRIERIDRLGLRRWSTSPPIEKIGFNGIDRLRQKGGDEAAVSIALSTPALTVAQEPLLVSGNRLLVSYLDVLSGLTVAWCLRLSTGDIMWSPEPMPDGARAATADGFLVGTSGYGTHHMFHYQHDGTVVGDWDTCGQPLISSRGRIRILETARPDRQPSRIRRLHRDGGKSAGDSLVAENPVAAPVLSSDGRVAFWRDGALRTVDHRLMVRTRWHLPGHHARGRMLLLDNGALVFIVESQTGETAALCFAETDLSPLDTGAWPCGGGSLSGGYSRRRN